MDTPVSNDLIATLLTKSSRAASGGNLQPWKIFVINNSTMRDFLLFQDKWDKPEKPAYEIYPQKLKEPYRTSRYELGENKCMNYWEYRERIRMEESLKL